MQFICPNPLAWNKVYIDLKRTWLESGCEAPQPPKPLVIDLWANSTDFEKAARWQATLTWALENSCFSLVSAIRSDDMYVGRA